MKVLLIIVIGLVFFSSSCYRHEYQAKRPKTSPKAHRLGAEDSDKREIDLLLKELMEKNVFHPEHSSGILLLTHETFQLKGIIWDAQKPCALIGESVVMVGDYVNGKKVVKINKNLVVLDDNGKEEILQLGGSRM